MCEPTKNATIIESLPPSFVFVSAGQEQQYDSMESVSLNDPPVLQICLQLHSTLLNKV